MTQSPRIALFISICCLLVVRGAAQGNNTTNPATVETISWQTSTFRLFVSVAFSLVLGIEREYINFEHHVQGLAGVRTHAMVSIASCLIQLISIYGYSAVPGANPERDPARLAAQSVSGIGFIGAGAIWTTSSNIRRGLTTAGTIWLAMAIGLASGESRACALPFDR